MSDMQNDTPIFETEFIGKVLVIRCPRELKMQDGIALSKNLQEIFETDATRIVFNLKGTNYMDSVGIGILLTKWKQSREMRGNVKLACVSSLVLEIMKSLGLTEILEIFQTEKEAIDSFQ